MSSDGKAVFEENPFGMKLTVQLVWGEVFSPTHTAIKESYAGQNGHYFDSFNEHIQSLMRRRYKVYFSPDSLYYATWTSASQVCFLQNTRSSIQYYHLK